MRQVETQGPVKSFADQVRELQSLHIAALQEKEKQIIALRDKLHKAEDELTKVRAKRQTTRRDGELKDECRHCLYRLDFQKRLGEGK
jgi:hypothetical protein